MPSRTRLDASGAFHHVPEFHRTRIANGFLMTFGVHLSEVAKHPGVLTSPHQKP